RPSHRLSWIEGEHVHGPGVLRAGDRMAEGARDAFLDQGVIVPCAPLGEEGDGSMTAEARRLVRRFPVLLDRLQAGREIRVGKGARVDGLRPGRVDVLVAARADLGAREASGSE